MRPHIIFAIIFAASAAAEIRSEMYAIRYLRFALLQQLVVAIKRSSSW